MKYSHIALAAVLCLPINLSISANDSDGWGELIIKPLLSAAMAFPAGAAIGFIPCSMKGRIAIGTSMGACLGRFNDNNLGNKNCPHFGLIGGMIGGTFGVLCGAALKIAAQSAYRGIYPQTTSKVIPPTNIPLPVIKAAPPTKAPIFCDSSFGYDSALFKLNLS